MGKQSSVCSGAWPSPHAAGRTSRVLTPSLESYYVKVNCSVLIRVSAGDVMMRKSERWRRSALLGLVAMLRWEAEA